LRKLQYVPGESYPRGGKILGQAAGAVCEGIRSVKISDGRQRGNLFKNVQFTTPPKGGRPVAAKIT